MATLLEVHSVSKSFPGARALDAVSFALGRGEVLAVVGENGAGKSTLMKILAGIEQPDSGAVLIDGTPVKIRSPREANKLGIALIHQELNLAENLTVAANIFLGREHRQGWFLQPSATEAASDSLLSQLGVNLSSRALVETLSPGQRQLIEIAKALSCEARALIMDEPTSSLSRAESEKLFETVRALRAGGTSIIYVSHRLGEVKALADRVVVLRDGRNAGELKGVEITHERMVQLMVGRDLDLTCARGALAETSVASAIEARGLRSAAHPRHSLTFTVKRGEIVGIAGLVGAGRTELLETLFGIRPSLGGSLFIDGKPLRLHSPVDAIRAGVALVPEDRKLQGVILEMAIRHNLALASLRRDFSAVFVNRRRERAVSADMIGRLRIRAHSDRQLVQYLSGGNQQKVALGKWLALKPRVLLLDEPTRGIDVGSKQEIYSLIEALAREGVAILFVSSDMEEVMRLSQRTLVMHEGAVTGELSAAELSEEAVMHLATGRPTA